MKRLLQKLLLGAALICCFQNAAVGQIKATEYYFDTDPGFGQGTITPFYYTAQDTTFTFSAGIGSLGNGLHRMYLRSYDTVRKTWSQSAAKMFYKQAVLSNPLVNVTDAEYFFDTDPGVGSANTVSVTAGQDISFVFSAGIMALNNGIHRLYVRTHDAAGRWSLGAPQFFYKGPQPISPSGNITRAEYFFDTDPGYGVATAIGMTTGPDITFSFNGGINALSNGIHRLYVRTQDAAGRWSMTGTQLFFKDAALSNPLVNVSKLEYFFDNDPGFGSGINVPVTAAQDIVSFNFSGSIASLDNGLHRLYVRSRDMAGKWSFSTQQLFYKEAAATTSLSNIVKAEYFFDADPGIGLATNAPITAGQDITFTFSGAISSLTNGMHRLYVRTLDAAGKWSTSAAKMFFKEPALSNALANVNKIEYFFDTDPGFGAGTDIPVTVATDISFSYNPSVAPLSTSAFHRLYIRGRDSNGKWSITTSQLFYLPPAVPPTPVKVTKLEYYIDSDPGPGAATNVPFTKGLDVTINFNASISSLSNGIHYLAVRSQDSIGRWSVTTQLMFYREAVQSNPLVNIAKAEYFIDNDPGLGAATNVPVTAGQDVTFGFSGNLSGLSRGLHRLYVRTRDAAGKWSLSAPQLFYSEPAVSTPLANIVKAEYFVDTDPGFGAATSAAVTAGQDISIPFTSSITTLSNGVHRLVVRTQDAIGKWSVSTPQLFFKEPILSHTAGYLTKLEWFWDTDPGFGAANVVSIPANTTDLASYSFTAAVPSSFGGSRHLFYVRANDDWGMTAVKVVDFTGVALPVTLLEFSANRESNRVRLNWKVANEFNMAQYVVERSGDGMHFDSIGARNAIAAKDYLTYDEHPLRGLNYYRLRQIETSAIVKYSPIVSVMFSEGSDDMSVYPNPALGHFNISARLPLANVTLRDMGGKAVRIYNDVSASYDLDGVAAGVYMVEVTNADGHIIQKPLVVQ